MPKFIELHNLNGRPFYVNVNEITLIIPGYESSDVYINDELNPCKETAEEILMKITECGEQKNV